MSDAASAIFISYAREDSVAADRIAEALRSHGIEVWFDQNELRGGEAWDQKIRNQIRTCTLLIPIVSAHTQGRGEGYFRREWKLAAERTHDMAAGIPFLVPVVIDETAESAAMVPEEFMRVQWTRLLHGRTTPEFAAQVKRLLEAPRGAVPKMEPGRPRPGERGESAASPLKPPEVGRRVPVAAWGITILAVAVALVAVVWRRAPESGSVPAPNAGAGTHSPSSGPAASSPPTAEKLLPATSKISEKSASADKSIAVLPLANMSEDKDTGFFADGVHEDLLTNLALVSELKVVSRTTVMQYRGSSKSMKQIGEELGVAYILEGSVRRSGNKVRVTGQLINARTDEHVWAKSYDRDLTDVFAIQASLSQEIAGALQAAITPSAQKFIERRPTENPVAYDAFLKGRELRNTMRSGLPAPLKQAEDYFQAAVDQDPKFAAAWGELAVVHALHAFWEIDKTPARLARGDAAIAHARALAPEAPDVINQVGTYAYYAYRDYAKATAQFEKLAPLRPNDPTVFSSLGLIQRRQGRWLESLGNSRRATELDPGNVSYARNLTATLIAGRRWPELIVEQRRVVTLLEEKSRPQSYLARLQFYATGSTKEIDQFLAGLTPEEANGPLAILVRKEIAADRGDFAEFVRLDRIQPYFEADGTQHYFQALEAATVYAASGDLPGARRRLGDFPAELRARIQSEPTNARIRGELGRMEALLGHNAEAVRLAREDVEMLPESRDALDGVNYSLWALVQVYAWIGDKDRALAEFAHLLRVPNGGGGVHVFGHGPWLAPLRGDPRFEALLNDPKNNEPLF